MHLLLPRCLLRKQTYRMSCKSLRTSTAAYSISGYEAVEEEVPHSSSCKWHWALDCGSCVCAKEAHIQSERIISDHEDDDDVIRGQSEWETVDWRRGLNMIDQDALHDTVMCVCGGRYQIFAPDRTRRISSIGGENGPPLSCLPSFWFHSDFLDPHQITRLCHRVTDCLFCLSLLPAHQKKAGNSVMRERRNRKKRSRRRWVPKVISNIT